MDWGPHDPRRAPPDARSRLDARRARHGGWIALRRGYLSSITNPKAAAFFGSIFVVMLPAYAPGWVYAAAVALLALLSAGWHCGLAVVFSVAPIQAGYRRAKAKIDTLVGAVLIAFGVRLAVAFCALLDTMQTLPSSGKVPVMDDHHHKIRRLSASDATAYRDLRLGGLQAHPEAFGASWEDEAAEPLAWFEDRLDRNVIFGGGIAGASELGGAVGFYSPESAKQRHKGVLRGMFVQPQARGTGLGPALVTRVLEHARSTVEEVRLTVVSTNAAAIRLYERAGFERYGLERRALKVGGDYHDEVLMAFSLR